MADNYLFDEYVTHNDLGMDFDATHAARKGSRSKALNFNTLFGDKDTVEKFTGLGTLNGLVLVSAVIVGAVMAEELEGATVTLEDRYKEFFLYFSIIAIPGMTISNVVLGSNEKFQSRQLGLAEAALAILFAIFYYRQQNPDEYTESDEYLNLVIVAGIWTMVNSIALGNPMQKSSSDKGIIKLHKWFQVANIPSHLASIAILISGPLGLSSYINPSS
jgi:hypothetical protein